MLDKIHIGRRKDFPWGKVVPGVLAALTIAGITTYVVRRVRNGDNLLPWKSQSGTLMDYESGFDTEMGDISDVRRSPTYQL